MSPLSPSSASAFLSSTATLAARSAIESDFDNFKSSFSSWDSCMSKAYCKWPVIAAIIVGSLIALSLLMCAARCLCCGLECCFGCFACCNACCPSPRGHSKTKYMPAPQQQQQPWPQQPPQPYGWQPDMAYGGPPATATFDAPGANRKGAAARAVMVGNGDALPAMPSWQTAQSRRVEEEEQEQGEIERQEEETALQEDGRHGIAMGAVGVAGRSQQQVRFGPVQTMEDEASVPMLNAPQPRQRGGYGDLNQEYGYNSNSYNNVDTAYAPPPQPRGVRFASPPQQQLQDQTPYPTTYANTNYDNTTTSPSNAYAPQQNPYTSHYNQTPAYNQPTAYTPQSHPSTTSYYAPTHTPSYPKTTAPTSPGDTHSIPPSYHSRAQTTSPGFGYGYGDQREHRHQQQQQLAYPGYGGGQDEVDEGWGVSGSGSGSGVGIGGNSGNGGMWGAGGSGSGREVARKLVTGSWREV